MTAPDLSALQQLLDREAIRDCIYRYCRGVDRGDEAALRSAYWPDATGRHGAYQGSGAAFVDWVLGNLASAGRSVHMIGNILIDLRGDVAAVESYFRTTLATRDAQDKPQETLLAGRYVDRFERREGQWRVADRTVVYDWLRQTPLASEISPESFGPRQPTGARKPDDPLYALLGQAPFDQPCSAS
jgi:ketosteroid isomerase-like protein